MHLLHCSACLLGTLLPNIGVDGGTPAQAPAVKLVTVDLAAFGDEDPVPNGLFADGGRNFLAELDRLREIGRDPDVGAIRLEPGHSLDSARAQDVVRELKGIRDAGKKIVCFAETLDRGSLWFASLADLLMVPPSGEIELSAPSIEVLYMKDLLARVGVAYDVLHVGEFKTAYEDMARSTMSEPQRVELTALLKEQYESAVEAIARHREVAPSQVEQGFEQVLIAPTQALALGLIDAVGYEDEFDAKVEALIGAKPEMVAEYGDSAADELKKKFDNPLALFSLLTEALEPQEEALSDEPRIAIVYATGAIMSGKSSLGFGGQTMGADTIVAALDAARDDVQVKAVVLRINSPGGSALASDLIWRAVQRCRGAKPVIASMGGVAASGGYWIAMGCDRILAQPGTITGSIGVVAAVPNLSAVFDKIGVKVEVVGYGPHAEEMSVMRDGLSPLLRGKLETSMQELYAEFVAKAAAGRKLDAAKLESHARGRVWTGKAAKEIGLIDGFGGLREAITYACFLAKLDPTTTPIRELPKAPDFIEQLSEQFEQFASVRAPLTKLAEELGAGSVVEALAPFLDAHDGTSRARMLAILPYAWRMR
ncbi:MAG: signal peptide peptidase SppA [Planctomycetes bacterium]|nr:signal peptide peptidase SppA [Planctomycetota bacterium]